MSKAELGKGHARPKLCATVRSGRRDRRGKGGDDSVIGDTDLGEEIGGQPGMVALSQQRKQRVDGGGTEGAQSFPRLLRVDEIVEAVEARNVIGELLPAGRAETRARSACVAMTFGKSESSWEGVRQRASISS